MSIASDSPCSNPQAFLGYRAFSKLPAKCQDYFVLRKFETLASRTALYLQDVVTEYESKLEKLDDEARRFEDETYCVYNGTFRNDVVRERVQLVRTDIPNALEKYCGYCHSRHKYSAQLTISVDTFVNQFSQFSNHPKPDTNAIKDIRNYLNWRTVKFPSGLEMGPIDSAEVAFICDENHEDDLVPVQPSNRSPLRRYLERFTYMIFRKVGVPDKFKRKPPQRSDQGEEGATSIPLEEEYGDFVIWAKEETIEGVASFITGFISLAMLIGPLWVLNTVQTTNGKLGVITGFLVLFYLLMSFATSARTSETIAAVSAYSAVLTIFLTLSGSSN